MCLLTGVLGAVIDWSGVGPNALRDRFAAILYLASALGWFEQLGIAAWEARVFAPMSNDMRIIWAMAAVVPVGFWVCAMLPALGPLGRFGGIQLRKSGGGGDGGKGKGKGKGGGSKAAPAGDRINGRLLGWTIAVACSVPTVMPASAYAAFVAAITVSVTKSSTAVGTAVGGFFGWS
jgi:hypothetical protein